VYEISTRKNESAELLEFLRKVKVGKYRMVGFNNIGYDYPMLHYILENAKLAKSRGQTFYITPDRLYAKSCSIFEEMKESQFGSQIKSADVIIPQVDLYKVHHFDNRARSTSLKMLENNMRSDEITDLPYPPGMHLNEEQMDVLVGYNKKDVWETCKFYHYSYDALVMREELSEQFGFDCTNFNDTKIGKELFVNRLEEARPGVCYKMVKQGPKMVRKMQQTKRKQIHLRDCVLPYVKFNRPEFQAIHQWFLNKTIIETKGSLSDLEEHELGDVAKYANMKVKSIKMNCPEQGSKNKRYVPTQKHVDELMALHPMGWIEMKELKSPKGTGSYYFCWRVTDGVAKLDGKPATSGPLNVVIDGFQFDFGTGGIHGACRGVHTSDDEWQIYTYDVASYYPNLSIKNRLYPAHLGELFCDIYQALYVERKSYDKKSAQNKALKLALNGTYGASNDKFSPMYDPQFTMSITINGQLLLCMLAEAMMDQVGAKMLMCNTDGFEFIARKSDMDKVKQLVADWEKLTGLEMEGELYSKMLIRDVNNYIAIKEKKVDG